MNPFEHSRSIAFELSNVCSLARGERRLDICQRCDTGRGL